MKNLKKPQLIAIAAAVAVAVLAIVILRVVGGDCKHEWQNATCGAPKTCAKCGATEGETLAHTWAEATCTAPKT